MSDIIVMRHPTLPATQEIEVPRDAMPHYTSAGWQLVPQAELDERAARKAKADAEAAAAARGEQPEADEATDTAEADDATDGAAEEAAPEATDEPEQSEPAPTKRPARRAKAAHKEEEN